MVQGLQKVGLAKQEGLPLTLERMTGSSERERRRRRGLTVSRESDT